MALDINFAFEGFRVIRSRPVLIPIWGAVLLIFYAAVFYLMASVMRPVMADMTQIVSAGGQPDPAAVIGMYQKMLPMYAVLIPVGLVFGAIMNCAVFRAVLRPSESSFGYLRFGGDELRQIGVNILLFLLILAAEIVLAIGIGLVVGILAAAVPKAMGLVGGIAILFVIGLVIWLIIRMSLYAVQTFDTKKINMFGTWSLTKGNFWGLLGGFIVSIVMALVVELLCGVVFGIVLIVVGLGVHTAPTAANPADPFGMLLSNPALLIPLAGFIFVVTPLMFAILIAPVAAAYKQLAGVTTGAEKAF